MTAECIRCGRPTPDGYVCVTETGRAAGQLTEIRDMVGAARDIATGQASHRGGGGSGKPGSRLPFDLGATARLDAVQGELTTWVRHIAEERGVQIVSKALEGRDLSDPIAKACSWLSGQMEWARHRPEVDELLSTIEACARIVRSLARGPVDQTYLGPCGAILECNPIRHAPDCPEGCGITEPVCNGDVYGRVRGETGRCKTCGAEYDQDERRIWLDDVRREHLYYASEIADAYPINVKTIRSWLSRGLLVAHGEHEGRPLLKLGEVLDLAAGDAARREEARAARARRAAAKAAESEEAA